jgi:tRNA pseudouridine55 synthase
MEGIIIVDKPAGWTSFDVVAKIRNLTGARRVGHSGTLDPIATGVLPVFLGKATKTIKYFLNGDKGYITEMVLGAKTDTGDATGKILNPKSETLNKSKIQISKSKIEEVFKKYTGEIMQTPPMYSAVKVNGKRLYELARKGIEVERKPRKIRIYELRLTDDDTGFAADNRISFYVLCSKGTYIRQLVADMGDDLGCGAYVSKISRVYSHPFHISQAHSMEAIVTLAGIGKLATIVLAPGDVLSSMEVKGGG